MIICGFRLSLRLNFWSQKEQRVKVTGGVNAWDSFSFEGTEMGVGGTVAGKVFGSFEAFEARLAREWF